MLPAIGMPSDAVGQVGKRLQALGGDLTGSSHRLHASKGHNLRLSY